MSHYVLSSTCGFPHCPLPNSHGTSEYIVFLPVHMEKLRFKGVQHFTQSHPSN